MRCKKRLVRRDELGDFIRTDRQIAVLCGFSLPLNGQEIWRWNSDLIEPQRFTDRSLPAIRGNL
jgi:hypothetical protein